MLSFAQHTRRYSSSPGRTGNYHSRLAAPAMSFKLTMGMSPF